MFIVYLPVTASTVIVHCESESSICTVLLTLAPAKAKVPPNMQPRQLQDEGFYVGTRPYVSSRNLNRMENRVLREAGGGYVTTDEEASIGESKDKRVSDELSCYP